MKQNYLINLLSRYLIKVELTLAVLIVAAVVYKYFYHSGETILLVLMCTLSMLYFISAYASTDATNIAGSIAFKVAGIASSAAVIGLLFTILRLSGAQQMLIVSVVSLGASGVVLFYNWFTSKKGNYFPILIRIAILGGVSLSTLLELTEQTKHLQ